MNTERGDDRCPICLNPTRLWYEGMFDDRYGMPGLYAVKQCMSCGLVKTYPSLCDEDATRIYATYYPRKDIDPVCLAQQVQDPTTVIGRLQIWLSGAGNQGHYSALPGMKVLDYGCGAGVSLLELRAMGVDGYGIEADTNVKRVAEHFGLKIYIGSLEEGPFPGVKFDLIVLNQAIEHIAEPCQLLRTLKGRLQDDGMVVCSFPNVDSIHRRLFGRRWINWHIPYHIYHFSLKSFTRLCEQEGWMVTRWKMVTPNVWTMLQVRALFARPRMGTPGALWSQAATHVTTNARGRQGSNATIAKVLRSGARRVTRWCVSAVVAVANRLIDLVGFGDSLVVWIKPKATT